MARRDSLGSAPELSITESFVGHEPFMVDPLAPARAEQTTISYGDRISNAPGARSPSRAPASRRSARSPSQSSSPEISIGESAVGRETLALITAELLPSTRDLPAPAALSIPTSITRAETPAVGEAANEIPFAIFEMLTFVVQGPETASLSSEALRRRFVEEHLLQRLPAKTMAQVDRVDVTPWTGRGTVVVRVWCKV